MNDFQKSMFFVLSTVMLLSSFNIASAENESKVLESFGNRVVLPTYRALDEKADVLLGKINALSENPSAATLSAAQDAWRAARGPWEQSEGFLFGPVDTEGHDPSLDSWPVNQTDLDKIIDPKTGPAALNAETIDVLGDGVKGFHAIEYVLFLDAEGERDLSSVVTTLKLQPRRLEYLKAAAEAFKSQTGALLAEYEPSKKNYVKQIIDAGQGSEVYPTSKDAIQEIVQSIIGIVDEVTNEKIRAPHEAKDTKLLESRFSFNTLRDVIDNIESVRKVYTGNDSVGISDLVRAKNADLDRKVMDQLAAFSGSVREIPEPYSNLNSDRIDAAVQAGSTLMATLEGEVLPLVIQ